MVAATLAKHSYPRKRPWWANVWHTAVGSRAVDTCGNVWRAACCVAPLCAASSVPGWTVPLYSILAPVLVFVVWKVTERRRAVTFYDL